jgi:hypothetical protein
VTLTNLISLHNGANLNNSGTLNGGSSALLVTLGGTIVNSAGGVITANQIQLTQASATLVNSGTIHANVEFANFANTVQLFTGSSVVGNLALGTNPGTNLILDGPGTQSLRQAVTGTITNSGNLTKQGAGTWIIDEELDAPVSTNVLAGVLTVNNTLNSPYVTVQSGATLMGAGNISGSVTNFGTISPGNSPGALTISGNYTQARSGTFNVQIASATSYDRLAVTGRANLDGTLRLTLLSGYRPVSTDQFTILTAGKGISGTFRTVIGPTGLPLQVIYGQHGVVQVTSGDVAPVTSGGVPQITSDPPAQAAPKPEFHLSDGTPDSTTALLANNSFNGFGSQAETLAASNKSSSIGITFDAGEFDFQGYHGETYGFPIAGQFKINDRARLEYEIPLQYVELPGFTRSFFNLHPSALTSRSAEKWDTSSLLICMGERSISVTSPPVSIPS